MCRIGLTINGSPFLTNEISEMQVNGANRETEIWQKKAITLIHNRFDVTSNNVDGGIFPLENERYVINYNGEVYGVGKNVFIDQSDHQSDVHFALQQLTDLGISEFLKEVDFQGTYQIYDKKDKVLYLIVDQLNTAGCFYAEYEGMFIGASEYAVVNRALKILGAKEDVPIQIVKNGTYLKISENGSKEIVEYRDLYRKIWSGDVETRDNLMKKVEEVRTALYEATRVRIPKTGPVGVLCSGGVDSSLILANVVKALSEKGEIARLHVFTLGDDMVGTQHDQNDLKNARLLINHLGLSEDKFLHIIPLDSIKQHQGITLSEKVFSDNPRLIPPNPILNTQLRHTVMMSAVLAYIAQFVSDIKVVLSGDGADEIFAGYNSMSEGVVNGDELRTNIQNKLNDFSLNDAARVILSSCHGATSVNKRFVVSPLLEELKEKFPKIISIIERLPQLTAEEVQENLEEIGVESEIAKGIVKSMHPIEVRMPFTSHKVLEALQDVNVNYAIGIINEDRVSKFLLRLVALESDVPKEIAVRKKIPFNEGATGVRNDQHDQAEVAVAKEYIDHEVLFDFTKWHQGNLYRLGIINLKDTINADFIDANHDKLALYHAAITAGLGRLLLGNSFRDMMPDTIYSTNLTGREYIPAKIMVKST